MIFVVVERLRDSFVEMLHDFFWWRGCVIFLVEGLRDFVCGKVA